jgi:hypothetical protein
MPGQQETLQTAFEGFVTASRKAFVLYGHDHFSACGQKYSTGPSGVYYCDGTQPGGPAEGPNWADNVNVTTTTDWGGLTNAADGVPDYCDTGANGANTSLSALQSTTTNPSTCGESNDTPSGSSFGSLSRGYIDVQVNGTTSVTLSQRTSILPDETALLAIQPNNTVEWTMTVP